ncbi:hypothetical protein C8J57DRAFT_1217137 [Mycena rebaudengoi]|nr:hypothetical protein C8J57DRAFT_1217137 [Mycena rebaudengoi]
MSRTNPISTEEFGTYTPQQQNEYLFLKLLDVEESNEQALRGIQSGGSNLEESLGDGRNPCGNERPSPGDDHDSTVVVTLEALAKAAEDLHEACEEARNNPQTVTAGTGSGTVRITTKQPRVAAPLIFNGNAEKVDQLLAVGLLDGFNARWIGKGESLDNNQAPSYLLYNRLSPMRRMEVNMNSLPQDVQTVPVSQHAPLGGLVVWRRSGLVHTSEKRGQLGGRSAWSEFSELSELNPNLVSWKESLVDVWKWFLGEEFDGLWVMLPHLVIRNGAFAGAYTHVWDPHTVLRLIGTPRCVGVAGAMRSRAGNSGYVGVEGAMVSGALVAAGVSTSGAGGVAAGLDSAPAGSIVSVLSVALEGAPVLCFLPAARVVFDLFVLLRVHRGDGLPDGLLDGSPSSQQFFWSGICVRGKVMYNKATKNFHSAIMEPNHINTTIMAQFSADAMADLDHAKVLTRKAEVLRLQVTYEQRQLAIAPHSAAQRARVNHTLCTLQYTITLLEDLAATLLDDASSTVSYAQACLSALATEWAHWRDRGGVEYSEGV